MAGFHVLHHTSEAAFDWSDVIIGVVVVVVLALVGFAIARVVARRKDE